uniref:COBW domain-containing protein 1 n=1 Tax=Rhizophora mucronata TaxID=61149 RepID=A0A2P2MU66_RHIMU
MFSVENILFGYFHISAFSWIGELPHMCELFAETGFLEWRINCINLLNPVYWFVIVSSYKYFYNLMHHSLYRI